MSNAPTFSAAILQEAARQHTILRRGVVTVLGTEKEIAGEKRDALFVKLCHSLATETPLKVKFGMDPTASDLHLGHTVPLTKLRQFQDLGHTAMPLLGDGTTLIGDPSGRDKTRPTLTLADIRQNAQTYLHQLDKVLKQDETLDLRWNGDWLLKLTYQDLVTICSDVTVAQLIERQDFAKRLAEGNPISLHELLYPIAQGYDSVAMACDIELGGTDQTFNLLMGRQLMERRKNRGESDVPPQIALTLPLLEGTDGVEKMSKSKNNYIGVTDAPNDMFGKIMSLSDAIMPKYYELLTDIDTATLPKHPMDAKKNLGRVIVTRFHDAQAAEAAQTHFETTFSKGEIPENIQEVTVALPEGGLGLLALLVQLGFCQSNSDARRLVLQGATKYDGEGLTDPKHQFTEAATFVLQAGKRHMAKVTLQKA